MFSIRGRTIGRYAWATTFFFLAVIASALTRAVVFARSDHAPAGPATYMRAFLVGAVFDILVAAWLTAPIVAYLTLVSRRRFTGFVQRMLRRSALAVFTAILIFVSAAETTFFDEFDGRFNFVAVDYLIYPTEVVTNIWQSYPMVWILLGIAVTSGLLMWLLRRSLAAFDQNDAMKFRARGGVAVAYLAALAVLTWSVSPALSHIGDDRVLNEVATNGYYTFWQALLGRDAAYQGLYASRPTDTIQARLRTMLAQETSPLPGARSIARTPPKNVVIVLEESLGSAFISAIHPRDSLPLTPSFDSLATQGVLLTRAYSTGNRTIRAIEATTASVPPLPGISIVRRPQSVDLFTLPAALRARGFRTEFIYGGRAIFDGMGSYVRNNGFERIVEQKDFPADAFKTAWGVADEVIFDRALSELDSLHATGAPFFSVILTVSNHKPYTYPTGRIPEDPAARRRAHAVRYADWALGRFMRSAASHAFYDSTLFVLMGDHGARVYGAAQIPLASYEVPILFYMPPQMAPARVTTLASSMDVAPTVLGLLGIHGPSKFLGRDLFSGDAVPGRAVMTHNTELALMRGDRIAVLGLRGETTVNRIDSTGAFHRIPVPDARDRALIEDAITYFEGADLLYRSGGLAFAPAGRTNVHARLRPDLP